MSAHGSSKGSAPADHSGDSHGGHGVRFETEDVETRPIYLAGIALVGITLAFIAVSTGLFWLLAKREDAKSPHLTALASQYARKQPPEPRLQSDAREDLLSMRAKENEQLAKLAWIDKSKGTVQIPIDRAMALLIAKGLPSRPGQSPSWLPAPTGIDPYFAPPAPPHAAEEGEEGAEHSEAHGH